MSTKHTPSVVLPTFEEYDRMLAQGISGHLVQYGICMLGPVANLRATEVAGDRGWITWLRDWAGSDACPVHEARNLPCMELGQALYLAERLGHIEKVPHVEYVTSSRFERAVQAHLAVPVPDGEDGDARLLVFDERIAIMRPKPRKFVAVKMATMTPYLERLTLYNLIAAMHEEAVRENNAQN